jgi:hypothetical protein
MFRFLFVAALALVITAPVSAAGISGKYIEARTCDVYTGACFANADTSLTGKHAVMAWQIDKGTAGDVRLDGLGVVAVIQASDTLGLKQTSTGKALLIVDNKANAAQRAALIALAKRQGGELLSNVIAVQTAPVSLTMCECKEGVCAVMEAGTARIETRCIDRVHDRGCGSESDFYPPLSRSVKARAAVAVEHSFTGKGFNETWKDAERRGAYVGSFEVR